MRSQVTDMLGVEFPILAFSHCRDVVAAVTKAGGFGVLGAVAHTPEQLDVDLALDRGTDPGRALRRRPPPAGQVRRGRGGRASTPTPCASCSPRPAGIRRRHPAALRRARAPGRPAARDRSATCSPTWPPRATSRCSTWPSPTTSRWWRAPWARRPPSLITRAHDAGVVGGGPGRQPSPTPSATTPPGSTSSWPRAPRPAATPARSPPWCSCPRSSTPWPRRRCWPRAASATAARSPPPWPSARRGVWCGSVWLTTEEAETHPAVKQKFLAATSRDTIRSRSLTGKPARMLRSAWTDEWEGADVTRRAAHAAAERARWPRPSAASAAGRRHRGIGSQQLANYFVGQVVGQLDAHPPRPPGRARHDDRVRRGGPALRRPGRRGVLGLGVPGAERRPSADGGRVGRERHGSVSNPTMKFDTRKGMGVVARPGGCRAGGRGCGRPCPTISARARRWPRHRWAPNPNATWSLGWRRMSKVSGSSNTVSSRLADG